MSENIKEMRSNLEIKNEEIQAEPAEVLNKKINPGYDNEHSKKQESRMMNFFNQEFFDRKIDFKPKYIKII
jgi:hypothetical protein